MKGVETHRGIRQSRELINPLIEINGKREPAAWGNAPLKEHTHKPSFKVQNFLKPNHLSSLSILSDFI
ncbi:MAG: hypothetical protein LUH63_04120 [Parabacteroides sp.]|nr:hypothetical protein [Parabacteroides sp.]